MADMLYIAKLPFQLKRKTRISFYITAYVLNAPGIPVKRDVLKCFDNCPVQSSRSIYKKI